MLYSAINYNIKKKFIFSLTYYMVIPITLNFLKFTKKLLLANKKSYNLWMGDFE